MELKVVPVLCYGDNKRPASVIVLHIITSKENVFIFGTYPGVFPYKLW